jgi:multiple antibiotic resistance protein
VLREVVSYSLISFSAIFFVVDPLAAVPMFLAMTKEDTAAKRHQMARRAAIACFLILSLFAVAGAFIFQALGITLAAFKVAGGVLLLLMSIDMLRSKPSATRVTESEVEAGVHKEDVAIVPLAMPILAGPGSIATVIVLMGRARATAWWHVVPVLGSILVTAVATFLILAAASRVQKVLGRTGMNVLERIAGLLLAAVAIQFMIDGLADAFPQLLRQVAAAKGA